MVLEQSTTFSDSVEMTLSGDTIESQIERTKTWQHTDGWLSTVAGQMGLQQYSISVQ
jgi:hypothetical protein